MADRRLPSGVAKAIALAKPPINQHQQLQGALMAAIAMAAMTVVVLLRPPCQRKRPNHQFHRFYTWIAESVEHLRARPKTLPRSQSFVNRQSSQFNFEEACTGRAARPGVSRRLYISGWRRDGTGWQHFTIFYRNNCVHCLAYSTIILLNTIV